MPAVQDNVVSYTVIVNVDNSGGSLLPGMTCAVEFIEERSEGILLVPNAALRYQPAALTEDAIAEMIFSAGLRSMSEEEKRIAVEQRKAALEARSQGGSAAASRTRNGGVVQGLTGMMTPRGPGMGPPPGNRSSGGDSRASASSGERPAMNPPKTLWYITGEGKLDCVLVAAGITDGSRTEIRLWGGDEAGVLEGLSVILREKV
jgi:HlyD family secretion protein